MLENKIIKLKERKLNNKKEVLEKLADILIEKKIVKESFKEAVIKRELKYPTGLQFESYGIALPHTESEYVNTSQIAIMTLEQPVKFIEMASDNKEIDVKTIFMLALKDKEQHIKILQKLIEIVQDEAVMNNLESFENSEENVNEIIKILEKYGLN